LVIFFCPLEKISILGTIETQLWRYIMKKIVLSAIVGTFLFSVNADQAAVAGLEESVVAVERGAHEVRECAFGGLYFGLGIGGSFYKNECPVGIKFTAVGMPLSLRFKDQNINRFIGTVALGAGKVFGDVFYLGFEGMMDFAESKKKDVCWEGMLSAADVRLESKNGVVVPSFGVRFGYVNNSWNTLFYGKVSASHASFEVRDKTDMDKYSVNKFAPALALGIERIFYKNFIARLEGEYRFASKEEYIFKRGSVEEKYKPKVNKGFAVRAIVAYNVKI
jgi:opacity protein-like surface antigen